MVLLLLSITKGGISTMLIRDVHPVVIETMNRQQSVVIIDHSVGAYTVPLSRILSMVKNHFVIDNSDHALFTSGPGDKASWIVAAIVRVEPTGNAFAATCWVDERRIQAIITGENDKKRPDHTRDEGNRDVEDAILLAYVESMNRMRSSNGANLYSSLNLFPPNLRKAFEDHHPDYSKGFNGPFVTQQPILHRIPLNSIWQGVAYQQPQSTMQPPAPDQFSKPASFGPGGFRVQPRPAQQPQQQPRPVPFDPSQDNVDTIDVQATPVEPPPSFKRSAANHISGMVNAILASGNTHGVLPTKPNETIGAFVNGNGEVIITYDDGSISPPVHPESLSIDPFEIAEAVQVQDPASVIPLQAFRKVPMGESMDYDE